MTLYELTGVYAELMEQYQTAETDEEAEQIWQQIDGLACDITTKADAYARVMKNKLADAAGYQAEADRLAKLAKREGVGEAILLREGLDLLLKKYDNCQIRVP